VLQQFAVGHVADLGLKRVAASSERSGGGRAVRSVVYKAEARADVARFGQRTTSSPRLRIPHPRALAALALADGQAETARALCPRPWPWPNGSACLAKRGPL
jgi:hypothetical protein